MNHSTTATVTVTDPVCGMTIDPAEAAGSSSFDGKTYHFCSHGCATKFEVAPAEYVGAPAVPAANGACCSTDRACC